MKTRTQWQGMLTILRFNWPFYLVAGIVFFSGVAWLIISDSTWMNIISLAAILSSGYFIFVSLGVSHVIYDKSDLYQWQWLKRVLGRGDNFNKIVFCHSGFDECSALLREAMDDAEWKILDHYDADVMSEASIRRARMLYPPTRETIMASYNKWPIDDETVDLVFAILAIHELRSPSERAGWFSEVKRCLRVGGRVVIVEHLRDFPNFVAFGPGFLHFHSRATWVRSWESSGFSMIDEMSITPWVRVFIITRNE